MKIQGKVHELFDIRQVTEKMSVQEFIIDISSVTPSGYRYTSYAKFQATNPDVLANVDIGDEVEVEFSISGRYYTSKKDGSMQFVQNLNAFSVMNLSTASRTKAPSQAKTAGNEPVRKANENDDLPF